MLQIALKWYSQSRIRQRRRRASGRQWWYRCGNHDGFPSGNGTAAMTARSMTGTSNQISVTNGDGTAGNPTLPGIRPDCAGYRVPSRCQQVLRFNNRLHRLNGMMRYNSTTGKFEFYQSGAWTNYATGNVVLHQVPQTIQLCVEWNGVGREHQRAN